MQPIQATGDRMVWLVQSERNSLTRYRVDLTALGGYGMCSCLDWSTRRSPNIKAKLPMGTREVQCKHVTAVRNHFLNSLLADLAKSECER